ncbi:MAG TPA: hypothetical protein ENI79_00785 [Rhodospirillales bacterium]|nr:hypothetical protein [Rhodospirillales bacterium]
MSLAYGPITMGAPGLGKNVLRGVMAAAAVLVISGCTGTRYVDFKDAEADSQLPGRTVAVEIDSQYYEDYPNCILIMPPSAAPGLGRIAGLVEAALTTRLTRKVTRVIGAVERDLAVRRTAVDLLYPGDRKFLLKTLGCGAFMTTEISGPGNTYYLVWSEFRIGIDMRLFRARDGRLLWRARHIADRSGGGLPLSPIGAIVETFSSTRFSADADVAESVVDDAVRRVVASLPDSRSY